MNDRASAEAIRRFVRQTLGCSCPDEILERLHWRSLTLPASRIPILRISVGDRLLLDVVPLEALREPEAEIPVLLGRGVASRDNLGLNRYRLALVCRRREPAMEARCEALLPRWDRAHLHWVGPQEVCDLPM